MNTASLPPAKFPNSKPCMAGLQLFPPWGQAMVPSSAIVSVLGHAPFTPYRAKLGPGHAFFPPCMEPRPFPPPAGLCQASCPPAVLRAAGWCLLCLPQVLDWDHWLDVAHKPAGHCPSGPLGRKIEYHWPNPQKKYELVMKRRISKFLLEKRRDFYVPSFCGNLLGLPIYKCIHIRI